MNQNYINTICAILDAGLKKMMEKSPLDAEQRIEIGMRYNLLAIRYWKAEGIEEEEVKSEENITFHPLFDEIDRLLKTFPVNKSEIIQHNSYNKQNKFRNEIAVPFSLVELAEVCVIEQEAVDVIVKLIQTLENLTEESINPTDDVANSDFIHLTPALKENIRAFIITRNLKEFKDTVENSLNDTQYGNFIDNSGYNPSFSIQLYDAIICLFRAFFRLFDYIITHCKGTQTLMKDTETPLAQKLTGRPHFFEYYPVPKAPKTPESIQLEQLRQEFSEEIDTLEKLALSTSSEETTEADSTYSPY